MNDDLKKSILTTLSYFDLFDYPLTRSELNQWLFGAEVAKGEVLNQAVDQLVQRGDISRRDGYYFFPGRNDLIDIRRERQQTSLKKIHKARRIVSVLSFVPGLRMVAICSNLGYLNAASEADIDLFIIAKPGRIWQVRFWCVLLMKLLGQRPTKKTAKDKICLSYFVVSDNLDLSSTKIGEPDVHLVYLLAQYLPIYDEDDCWHKFVRVNHWISNYLPYFQYDGRELRYLIKPHLIWLKKILALFQLPGAEKIYRRLQLAILPPILKAMMNRGDNKVIINDRMLKLHTNDKREEYNHKLKTQMSKLLTLNLPTIFN